MLRSLVLAAAIAVPCLAQAADVVGTITILEGQAQVFRGLGRVQAAEGVRLSAGDIVETAAATFAQVEMVDQTIAQLGPATRLMIGEVGPRQKGGRFLYLMNGWIKLVAPKREAGAAPGLDLRSAQFEVPAAQATVVLHSLPGTLDAFAESGSARIVERQPGGNAGGTMSLKSGDYYQRKFPSRGVVASVSPPAFVADMPRAFRDSLPPRMERFKERVVQPKDAPAFDYADVEAWLQAEPVVRRPLMQRWRSKAREPAFRAALVANLRAHPEWDPILFPEKYLPKDPPRPAVAVGRAASEAASSVAR